VKRALENAGSDLRLCHDVSAILAHIIGWNVGNGARLVGVNSGISGSRPFSIGIESRDSGSGSRFSNSKNKSNTASDIFQIRMNYPLKFKVDLNLTDQVHANCAPSYAIRYLHLY
jgi:hypothetical protein